uniref:Uncharacterized protein n=1 Tax=Agrobacterium tumefaciens TaxID=358 RepID=A0A2Z2Q2C4_AGRTU|nr:hypothetical protein [Agrobacterium radiobacter]
MYYNYYYDIVCCCNFIMVKNINYVTDDVNNIMAFENKLRDILRKVVDKVLQNDKLYDQLKHQKH